MEKLTKQDLKGPDAFISNMSRISSWAYDFRKHIFAILALATVAGIAWAAMGTYTAKQEDAAEETLFAAEKTFKTTQSHFEAPKFDAQGKPLKDAKPLAVRTGQVTTDYKDALDQLKDVVNRFPKTQAAVIAALDLNSIYREYNQSAEAVPVLENAARFSNHPTTKGLVLLNLGTALEGKGDCQGAITQWQKIQDDKGMTSLQGNALVKEALCYEKLNQKDKATEIYKRFDQAESEQKQLLESLASKYHLMLSIPLQYQPKEQVAAFEKEARKSKEIQHAEQLLSDREAVKAAKKYLQLLKQGQS